MTAEDLVRAAVEVAEEGLAGGELPIGAVVALGDEIIGRSSTQEHARGRRLVHAEFLALTEADELLGWRPRPQPLVLATTLEPCMMCLGAAMSMDVAEIHYGLPSPSDGAARLSGWQPRQPGEAFARIPRLSEETRPS